MHGRESVCQLDMQFCLQTWTLKTPGTGESGLREYHRFSRSPLMSCLPGHPAEDMCTRHATPGPTFVGNSTLTDPR